MSGKVKSRAKKVAKKKSSPRIPQLNVEILQFGFPQAVGQWSAKRFFSKEITFGVGSGADLHLPFTKLPPKIRIFEIRDGKVFVVLDPRVEGFINRGQEFGDVKEFLSPRGALAEVATIDEPLRVELKPGSRGSLRIYGFEAIFKYDLPPPPPKSVHVEGAGGGFLAHDVFDSPLEARALWIAFAALVCVLIPFGMWVKYASSQEYRSLTSLPQEFLLRVVSPEHYPPLPRILDGDGGTYQGSQGASFTSVSEDESQKDPRKYFRRDVVVNQAAYVVAELQKRWRKNEDGERVTSHIELLRMDLPDSAPEAGEARVAQKWKQAADFYYGNLKAQRTAPGADRYYTFQADTPRLAIMTTGEKRGSLRLRAQKRIEQTRRMYRSLVSLVETEQAFLRRFYGETISFMSRADTERKTALGVVKDSGVDLGPLFRMPAEAIFSSKPEQRFLWEIEKYQAAQALSEYAALLPDRWRPREDRKEDGAQFGSPFVWLERDGALVPTFTGVRISGVSDAESAVAQNAMYSVAEKEIPPAPPPAPRIDEQAVKFLIIGKKEQIKLCYEALLRRNPKATGDVRVRWTIEQGGRARDASIVSATLQDKELQNCLKARLLQWRFPEPKNGSVSFEYPFQFTTKPR
jgi:hypothetical protein